MEEARRANADLLARKAREEEVTPASSVPDLKAIVSASSDNKVKTKMTSSSTRNDTSGNDLDTKTTNDEIEIKTAKDGALFSESGNKV